MLKSIVALPEFQAQTQKAKVIKEWRPIAKTFAAKSTHLFGALASVDASQAFYQFTQAMLAGRTDPKKALTDFQNALSAIVKN